MDGYMLWIDGWASRCYEWMDKLMLSMDGQMNGWIYVMDRWMDGWASRCYEWMDKLMLSMDGWIYVMDKMDGWMGK